VSARQYSNVEVRRLAWAGVDFRCGETRLLIDPLRDASALSGFLGEPRTPMGSIELSAETHALVTHLHRDHADYDLLAEINAVGTVGCHEAVAGPLAAAGIDVVPQAMRVPRRIGALTVTPVPSADWQGIDQVAWVVEANGTRMIHCGDTMWHGHWWAIARDYGPFDVAFLPINGVIVRREGFTPTAVPATLTPEQAVEAAAVLGASTACAIHHSTFHNPPYYVEQPDAPNRFLAAAAKRGIKAVLPADGARVL
jgi:L-ascorbate metabolism protein UlaG (beta-lactamase superfamily)